MVDVLIRVATVLLALTFGWAGLMKWLALSRWRVAVSHYGLPAPLELAAFGITPILEIAVAVLLLAGPPRVGAALALGLVAGFCALLVRARGLHGDRVPCGCFGREQEQDVGLLLVRNAMLATLSVFVLLASTDDRVSASFPRADEMLPALLVVVGLGTVLWTVKRALSSLWTREGR